jgi:thiopeptide-type bacteriocin biosynthesis protein
MAPDASTTPDPGPRPYAAAGFFVLRAPVLPARVFAELTAASVPAGTAAGDLAGRLDQARQQSFAVVRRLAHDPVVRQALAVASTDLSHGLRKVEQGNGDRRRTERAYGSLFSYLVRMSTRPTPFGLFAGVGFGTLADTTTVHLEVPCLRRLRARPDMGWLVAAIKQVEGDEDLARQLEVLVNHLAYDTGAHLVVPQPDIDRENDDRAVVLRAGRAVRYVLREARTSIPYRTLRDRLHDAFPDVPARRVDAVLRELLGHHVLVSNLRPPLTDPDPAGHVLRRLHRVAGAADLRRRLAGILTTMGEIDRAGVGAPARLIDDLVATQQALAGVPHQTVQVDAALSLAAPRLNAEVGDALADAAGTLLRLTPDADELPHLRQYRAAFEERYGSETEVPVKELLCPERGLDAPPTYQWPQRSYPLPPADPEGPPARDEVLSAVLAEALRTGTRQVELDDELVRRLSQPEPAAGPPARAVELVVQLAAASREALDAGAWRAVIEPVPGGRMLGRFIDLLGDEALQALRSYAIREEELFPEAIFAELSYFPSGRRGNVAVRPLLRSHEVVVNTTPSVPPERVLDLDDLVVGVRDRHFYLRSVGRGRRVVVTQSHMLNLALAPNVCRFLVEVSADGRPQPLAFDWGMAGNAPYLPRLARGRIVLSPARWHLRSSSLGGMPAVADDERCFLALQRWRARWQAPRHVYLVEGDARLLLDLEHPLSVGQLRRKLDRTEAAGPVQLQELLPGFEDLWLRDADEQPFFSELVVPLLPRPEATASGRRRPVPSRRVDPVGRVPDDVRYLLPGGRWTYLKLYAPARQHEELIAGPVREMARVLQRQGHVDHWFFVRYADPAPHLRVRFHAAADAAREAVLVEATAWASGLARHGLVNRMVVDSYVREVERYGGPDGVAAMEEVFGADSALVAGILAAVRSGRLTLDPTVVAGCTLDRLFARYGLDLPGRLRLLDGLGAGDGVPVAPLQERRVLLCELLVAEDARRGSLPQEQAEQDRRLGDLWAVHQPALETAFARVRELAEHGKLWKPEAEILASLAHMHLNRLLGTDAERERTVYALWRHSLRSIHRRALAGARA